jgi:hypothetical protein
MESASNVYRGIKEFVVVFLSLWFQLNITTKP